MGGEGYKYGRRGIQVWEEVWEERDTSMGGSMGGEGYKYGRRGIQVGRRGEH